MTGGTVDPNAVEAGLQAAAGVAAAAGPVGVQVSAALLLLSALLSSATKVSAAIAEAHAKGETTLSTDAWAGITGAADKADSDLDAAIAAAKAAGK